MAAMNMNQEQFEQATRGESPFWWISGRPGAAIAGGSALAYEKIGEEYADSPRCQQDQY